MPRTVMASGPGKNLNKANSPDLFIELQKKKKKKPRAFRYRSSTTHFSPTLYGLTLFGRYDLYEATLIACLHYYTHLQHYIPTYNKRLQLDVRWLITGKRKPRTSMLPFPSLSPNQLTLFPMRPS